ncbi:hypothetical protein KR054_008443, partial [Drosophila jambulina]
IGVGFYGRVYMGHWQGRTVAVKEIYVGKADQQIEREVHQLSKLQHKNIVTLYGISKHDDKFILLVEHADCGALSNHIHTKSQIFTLAHCFNWAHQLAQGLAYLHGMKPKAIIHRDIKPNNAVLSRMGLSLQICDFGTVVDLTTSMTAEVGTCLYKAPEVFKGGAYNEKCDVHSWAITFWEILARKQPFDTCKTPYAVGFAVRKGKRPSLKYDTIRSDCPEDIISLISACWAPEPSKRFSMEFVANIMNKALTNAGPLRPIDFFH